MFDSEFKVLRGKEWKPEARLLKTGFALFLLSLLVAAIAPYATSFSLDAVQTILTLITLAGPLIIIFWVGRISSRIWSKELKSDTRYYLMSLPRSRAAIWRVKAGQFLFTICTGAMISWLLLLLSGTASNMAITVYGKGWSSDSFHPDRLREYFTSWWQVTTLMAPLSLPIAFTIIALFPLAIVPMLQSKHRDQSKQATKLMIVPLLIWIALFVFGRQYFWPMVLVSVLVALWFCYVHYRAFFAFAPPSPRIR